MLVLLIYHAAAKEKGGSKIKIILLTVIPGILLIGFNILFLWYARVKKNHAGQMVKGKLLNESESQEAMELPLFSFSTRADATASFSPDYKIAEGGFGPVYKSIKDDVGLRTMEEINMKVFYHAWRGTCVKKYAPSHRPPLEAKIACGLFGGPISLRMWSTAWKIRVHMLSFGEFQLLVAFFLEASKSR